MWEQHDHYMKQLKQLYNKTSRQTQNRLKKSLIRLILHQRTYIILLIIRLKKNKYIYRAVGKNKDY